MIHPSDKWDLLGEGLCRNADDDAGNPFSFSGDEYASEVSQPYTAAGCEEKCDEEEDEEGIEITAIEYDRWPNRCECHPAVDRIHSLKPDKNEYCYIKKCPTCVRIETMINDVEERNAWLAADTGRPVMVDECKECGGYPHYLALHNDARRVDTFDYSLQILQRFLAWKRPDCKVTTMEEVRLYDLGDMRGRALFLRGDKLRSEDDRRVKGTKFVAIPCSLCGDCNSTGTAGFGPSQSSPPSQVDFFNDIDLGSMLETNNEDEDEDGDEEDTASTPSDVPAELTGILSKVEENSARMLVVAATGIMLLSS